MAAPDAKNPHYTVRKAINYTIIGLVSLYILSITLLLPLVPTEKLGADISPFVTGLSSAGLQWGASLMNLILIIAILSTMLAAVYGLGRMIHSLAEDGYAPSWLKQQDGIPRKGILFSGLIMLAGVAAANLLPNRFYIFLVSSGGFALLFAYLIIMATHYKFRRLYGCPPKGHCQLYGYPYSSIFGIVALIGIILSMPLVSGQGSGLFAGFVLVVFFALVYTGFFHKAKSTIK